MIAHAPLPRVGPLPKVLRWLRWYRLGLSWASIGWACTGVSIAGALRAQDDTAVRADVVRAVLNELDALFARGDVAGYLALFAPDHPGAHAMLQRRLERLVAATPARERTSAIVGHPRTIGERTVVHVRHDVVLRATAGSTGSATGNAGSERSDARFTADSVLALRADAGDRATPTFAVEIADGNGWVRNDRLRCEACNYEVGGVSGWLCVTPRADAACSFETASFYLIGTDVACDVSVRVDSGGRDGPGAGGPERPPTAIAQELADALREVEPKARPGVAESWLPCSLAPTPPRGFAGARVEVGLPDCAGDGGARALFHVATFGTLQHLLLARGSAASLQRHANALTALLASYRLLDANADAVASAATALAHHTGGALDRGTYRNTHHRVELAGPAGWPAVQHAGGAAFRVVWSSADGGRLWLTGQRVPPGMRRWCRTTADRWVQALCERHGLTIAPAAPGTQPWEHVPECGAMARTVVAMPAGGDAPQQRWIRVLLQDDLLVIADGFATTTADETALRTALASLRRM